MAGKLDESCTAPSKSPECGSRSTTNWPSPSQRNAQRCRRKPRRAGSSWVSPMTGRDSWRRGFYCCEPLFDWQHDEACRCWLLGNECMMRPCSCQCAWTQDRWKRSLQFRRESAPIVICEDAIELTHRVEINVRLEFQQCLETQHNRAYALA